MNPLFIVPFLSLGFGYYYGKISNQNIVSLSPPKTFPKTLLSDIGKDFKFKRHVDTCEKNKLYYTEFDKLLTDIHKPKELKPVNYPTKIASMNLVEELKNKLKIRRDFMLQSG